MITRIPSPAVALGLAGLAGLAVLSALAVPASPAAAHPFGPPSTARISVHGSRVDLAWLAAEDD